MHDPRRSDYPPRVQRWRFADPPIKRGWFWAAVVAGPLGVVAFVGSIIAMAVIDSRDSPGVIDDTRVLEVVVSECALMTSTVAELPLAGTPNERADRVRAQNSAVEVMVDAIRNLGDETLANDAPLLDWLDDWERLVEAREDYADALAVGKQPTLEIPTDEDGEEIIERMDSAGLLSCEVPEELVAPVFSDAQQT